MVQYRRATLADQPELMRMAQAFATSDLYRLKFHAESVEALIAHVLAQGVIFVAARDGTLIGMLAGVPSKHLIEDDYQACEVSWWVDPASRNGTVGPKLLRFFEDWARQEGLSVVRMTAPAGSDLGTFYERVGYRPLETVYLKNLDPGG